MPPGFSTCVDFASFPPSVWPVVDACLFMFTLSNVMDRLQLLTVLVVFVITVVVWRSDRRMFLAGGVSKLYMDDTCQNLYLNARIGDVDTIFLIDTGFAGPPVINTHYITQAFFEKGRYSVIERAKMVDRKQFTPGHDAAVSKFISQTGARDYTAGCRVNLTGISSSYQRHSDLLLVPTIAFMSTTGQFSTPGADRGDVCVTNVMKNTPHVLTTDYIVHNSPCLISVSDGVVEWRMSLSRVASVRPFFTFVQTEWFGGAMVCDIVVGAASMRCVVDTGSEMCVTLGKNSLSKIKSHKKSGRSVTQSGVSGQRTCSDVILADVRFGGTTSRDCFVTVNSSDLPQVDGYMGMGLLRCYDLLLADHQLFVRRNKAWDPLRDEVGALGSCK